MFKRIKECLRHWDRDAMRERLAHPYWIEYDQKRRFEMFKHGLDAGIAYMSVSGYVEYTNKRTALRWTVADMPLPGEWEIIIRRTDV